MSVQGIKERKAARGTAKSLVTKKINCIRQLMKAECDSDDLRKEANELHNLAEDFETLHKEYQGLLESQEEISQAQNYYEAVMNKVEYAATRIRQHFESTMAPKLTALPPPIDSSSTMPPESVVLPEQQQLGAKSLKETSRFSKGKSSSKSANSKISTYKARASAKKAALIAEANMLEQQKELEIEELKLQQKKRTLKLQTDIAKASAEEQVLAISEGGDSGSDPVAGRDDLPDPLPLETETRTRNWVQQQADYTHHINPLATELQPTVTAGYQESPRPDMQQLVDMMQLPRSELIKFKGDPSEFWLFMRSFDQMVDSANVTAASKLNRLLQYCDGEARDVIRCCTILDPEAGYPRARRLLQERFGNNFQIVESWVKRLTEGPPIKPGDRRSLQLFADDLRSYMITLEAVKCTDELDSKRNMVSIVRRLPLFLQSRWRTKALEHLDQNSKYPGIKQLSEFLDRVAREMNDPIFGVLDAQGKTEKPMKREAKAFVLQGEPSRTTPQPQQPKCAFCNDNHRIDKCKDFLKLNDAERFNFARRKRLCFNCLGYKHLSRKCSRSSCGLDGCKDKHSKLLHLWFHKSSKETVEGTNIEEAPEIEAGATSCVCQMPDEEDAKTSLPVVSILVKSSTKSIVTHALLDPGSNKTFCSSDLLATLGLKGVKRILNLSTLNNGSSCEVREISLEVCPLPEVQPDGESINLKKVYAIQKFPSLRNAVILRSEAEQWDHLKDLPLPCINSYEDVMMLIGQDNADAFKPLELRDGKSGDPYAIKTPLGWAVNGNLSMPLTSAPIQQAIVNLTISGNELSDQVKCFWHIDSYGTGDVPEMSLDDKRTLEIWNQSIVKRDGHYMMDIPFKEYPPGLPDNFDMAKRRLMYLKRKLEKNPTLCEKYLKNMVDLFEKGFAETVDNPFAPTECTWYLPHHGVQTPTKPKLRTVFDCSVKCDDMSLNMKVLQGPDLTSCLIGVLLRFREAHFALMSDVEAMFNQVLVTPKHRDALRFLWFPDGNLNEQPRVYRMTRHLFGGTWSPSAANFALQRTAIDNKDNFDAVAVEAVMKNFYVDDCLKSFWTEEHAIRFVNELTSLLARGGFHITKWVSNSKAVMETIPPSEQAESIRNVDLSTDAGSLTQERALGLCWEVDADRLCVRTNVKDKPMTKRGLLSTLSSVYDPLGIVCPYVLLAKLLFQSECRLKKEWDQPLEDTAQVQWQMWLSNLPVLDHFGISRCFVPKSFGSILTVELHIFVDASQAAYAAVAYLRLVDVNGNIFCSFVIAKCRLAPLKTLTIPRLELCAALMGVRIDETLRREMRPGIQTTYFWTDSMILLRYINNSDKRFKTFVANRLSAIHEQSSPSQWYHIASDMNPADVATRGLSAQQLIDNKVWLHGPEFLWDSSSNWNMSTILSDVQNTDDLEIKLDTAKIKANTVVANDNQDPLSLFIRHFSSWYRLKKGIAWLLRLKCFLLQKVKKSSNMKLLTGRLTVQELYEAEKSIIMYLQDVHFQKEKAALAHLSTDASKTDSKQRSSKKILRSSCLFKLDPVLASNGLICIGSRIKHKHQPIIPRDEHVVLLIIRDTHEKTGHSGREHVMAKLRDKYWIVRARPMVRRLLSSCTICRRRDARLETQRMADLPNERLESGNPPFLRVGVDCFGPFFAKRGRAQVKRYGCLFTCLATRAIHIELLFSLETDSFLNGLFRFISRRGAPELIRSDCGTNFIGANKELKKAIQNWNQEHFDTTLQQQNI